MKHVTALMLGLILTFSAVVGVSAQAAETIWMETSKQSYSAGETIIVTLKANTATLVQGFTFQLRYDPACLQPTAPTSPLTGLNYMPVPQTAGLVDAIFASTTPLNANGSLAEVKFKALASCQTSLQLEKASLAVADASGMAVPLAGISLGASNLVLNLSGAEAAAPETKPTSASENNLAAAPEINLTSTSIPVSNEQGDSLGPLGILLGLFLFVGVILTVVLVARGRRPSEYRSAPLTETPVLFIKRGPRAGTSLPLVVFPCRIGSDPKNEICLNDPRISSAHAQILADKDGYILVDLGSQIGTYINGRLIKNQQALLKPGDVLRLAGVLLVFSPV